MKHQKKIIEGEWEEMCGSVEANDIDTLRNDIADVLFTVYGMAARLSIPADADFKRSVKANLQNLITLSLKLLQHVISMLRWELLPITTSRLVKMGQLLCNLFSD